MSMSALSVLRYKMRRDAEVAYLKERVLTLNIELAQAHQRIAELEDELGRSEVRRYEP